MATEEQWRQLRTLDRIAAKVKGTHREKYIFEQMAKLKQEMRLSRAALGADGDTGTEEHLPNSLSANAELFPDL